MQDVTNHANPQQQQTPSATADIFQDPALAARRANVAAGTVLFETDDAPANVYYIHRGQVRLYQAGPEGEQRLVEILGPDEWFGIAAFAKAHRYGVRAVVVAPAVISEVRADQLMGVLRNKPEAMFEINRQLAAKVQTSRDEAANLIFQDCNSRLIDTLVRFSRSAAATQQEDGVVLRITHHQLAQAVGVARETVSLALTQLRQRNLLRTGRNQLFFNPESLRQINTRNVTVTVKATNSNGHAVVEQREKVA
jgi:CRP/FNR family cyclic AMP-dependent transcriptional regulator